MRMEEKKEKVVQVKVDHHNQNLHQKVMIKKKVKRKTKKY